MRQKQFTQKTQCDKSDFLFHFPPQKFSLPPRLSKNLPDPWHTIPLVLSIPEPLTSIEQKLLLAYYELPSKTKKFIYPSNFFIHQKISSNRSWRYIHILECGFLYFVAMALMYNIVYLKSSKIKIHG